MTLILYLQTLNWLQVLLINANYSICTQSNGFKCCYVITMIQFGQTVKEFQVLILITNNSIPHFSFICTQLRDQTVLFQKIQFNMSFFDRVWISNSSIWSIDRTLSSATTLVKNGPGSNGNEGVLYIPLPD